MSANCDVFVSFTWRGFLRRGGIHYHGWGVAWYLDGGVGLVKEPRPAPESPVARLLLDGVRSRIVISHVRLASRGVPCYVNTHPFVRKLGGREWVFAHNGTVSGIIGGSGFKLRHYFPVGETDSEYAFCYIMDNLRRLGNGIQDNILKVARAVWEVAVRIGDYGKFNFLLSNGRYLFAFMNEAGTLHYLLRHPPHQGVIHLMDEDFEISLEEMKSPDEQAAVIATKPLTDEVWEPFETDTLYVFYNGDLILKVGAQGEAEHTLSDIEAEVLRYVKKSPHSVKLKDIARKLNLSNNEAHKIVRKLMTKGFLRQHSRDKVPPNCLEARFYTESDKVEIIETLLPHED